MQEPPLITIRDPARDAPLSDVIGSGSEREVTRRQRRWAWALVAVVAVAGAGIWGVQQLQEQRRLDRAALHEVSVDLVGNDLIAPEKKGVAQLTLSSAGKHPLTVLSARLDLPSFPELRAVPTSLRRGEPTVVDFQLPASCPAGVVGQPTRVDLRVRTWRGGTTTVHLDPRVGQGAFSTVFVYEALGRCGRAGAGGLDATPHLQTGPFALDLALAVHNSSGVPRALGDVMVGGGIDNLGSGDVLAGPAPPLTFAPDQRGELRLTLAVNDCAEATTAWAGHAPGGITAHVLGAAEDTVLVPFGDATVSRWVRQVCAQQGSTDVSIDPGFSGVISVPS